VQRGRARHAIRHGAEQEALVFGTPLAIDFEKFQIAVDRGFAVPAVVWAGLAIDDRTASYAWLRLAARHP
jgi:hypothetical protein